MLYCPCPPWGYIFQVVFPLPSKLAVGNRNLVSFAVLGIESKALHGRQVEVI